MRRATRERLERLERLEAMVNRLSADVHKLECPHTKTTWETSCWGPNRWYKVCASCGKTLRVVSEAEYLAEKSKRLKAEAKEIDAKLKDAK